jgi:hypothetical protein
MKKMKNKNIKPTGLTQMNSSFLVSVSILFF